jgi:hypothetical protein
MMRAAILTLALAGAVAPPGAAAQEPATRAEVAERERQEKARSLQPPVQGRIERALVALENGQLLERALNPAEGFYPKMGTITPGSGFSLGPGYNRAGIIGEEIDLRVFGLGSLQKYWMLEAGLHMPELAGGRLFGNVVVNAYDFPTVDYFGPGTFARRDDAVNYGLRNRTIGGTGGIRLARWLSVGGAVAGMTPRVHRGDGDRFIEDLFPRADVPGLDADVDYYRYEAFIDLNRNEPRGNPRSGGRYLLTYQRYDDRGADRYSFNRFEADLQQYVPIVKDRRIFALHALVSTSDADQGQDVPFYFQRTLGGPDDLRGFRRYRFRDRHLLLLQAEYRFEVFTAVDGAIFYDAGKVTSRREDLNFKDLQRDYGIGFRFGSRNGVFLRIEGAFGSNDGKHFVATFGNAF